MPKSYSRSRSRSRRRKRSSSSSRSRSRRRKRSSSSSRSRSRSRSSSPQPRTRSPIYTKAPLERNKLYIGNLSFRTHEEDLRKEFERFGRIEDIYLPSDRDTGRPRGFGFITYEDSRDARDAAEEMDGAELDGRALKVNIARTKPDALPANPDGYGGGYGGGSSSSSVIGSYGSGGSRRYGPGAYDGGRSFGSEFCRDFQRGDCIRTNCRFSHGGSDRDRNRDRY